MSQDQQVLDAFLAFLDARIEEKVNDRLGAGSVEDSVRTRALKEIWLKLVEGGS